MNSEAVNRHHPRVSTSSSQVCLSFVQNGMSLENYTGQDVAPREERSLMVLWVVGSILHGVDPLCCFSFQPVLYDWCDKGCGMCYPVCGMVHIKEPLLLIDKSSLCGGSGFPLSLSVWSFTICLMPYNRKLNVLSALLNKTFPSSLPSFQNSMSLENYTNMTQHYTI